MLLLSNLRMEKMQGKMFQEIRNWLIGISAEKIFWNGAKKSGQVSAGSQHLYVVLLFLVIEVLASIKNVLLLVMKSIYKMTVEFEMLQLVSRTWYFYVCVAVYVTNGKLKLTYTLSYLR